MSHTRLPAYLLATAVVTLIALLALLAHNHSATSPDVPLVATWPRRAPDAVIIGVKKGGTRALLEMLKLHPRVVSPAGEIHFYDRNFERGTEWYLSRMPPASPSHLIVEKTPSYFVTPDAPGQMAGVNPNTKVVLVAREPVARLVSDYVQLWRGGGDFDTFVLAADGQVLEKSRPVWTGLYANHLLHWTQVFPPDQIHVANGDRLIRDPGAEMIPLQRFLGLEPLVTEDTFYYNSSKGFFCWHSELDRSCLGEGKGRLHPEVSPGTLRKLRAFYSEPNRAFVRILRSLGKPVSFEWN